MPEINTCRLQQALLISIIPLLRFLGGKNPTAVLKSELYYESEKENTFL
jgi:hypothetical protein